MELPFSDMADKFSILILKWIHGVGDVKELVAFSDVCPMTEKFFELLQSNARIWKLENALKDGREEELSLEEIGRRALAIRDENRTRISLKNAIAKEMGEPQEVKIDHASEDRHLLDHAERGADSPVLPAALRKGRHQDIRLGGPKRRQDKGAAGKASAGNPPSPGQARRR